MHIPNSAARYVLAFSAMASVGLFGPGCDSSPPQLITKPAQTAPAADDDSGISPPTAAEREEALRRLDKAIAAHGGNNRLNRLRSMTMEMKGMLQPAPDLRLPAEQRLTIQFPGRLRLATDLTKDSGRERVELAIYPGGGWHKGQGLVEDMPGPQLADTQRELFVQWLMTLLPVRNEQFELRPLPDSKVYDRVLTGISVRRTDQPTVQLYFNKDSGLLTRVVVPRWEEAGQKQLREILITDHKKTDNITLPAALTESRGNNPFLSWVSIDYRFDEIDAKFFDKP